MLCIFNFKKFVKLLIQLCCIWLSDVGVLLTAMLCEYQLPAELICSVCVQIMNYEPVHAQKRATQQGIDIYI
jgi:hypothetical protein